MEDPCCISDLPSPDLFPYRLAINTIALYVCMYLCMNACKCMYLTLYGNKYLYVSIGCLRGCSFDASIKGFPRCNKASSQVGTLPTYIPTAANDRVHGVFHSAVTIDNAIVTSKSGDSQEESVSVFVNNGGKMITFRRFFFIRYFTIK